MNRSPVEVYADIRRVSADFGESQREYQRKLQIVRSISEDFFRAVADLHCTEKEVHEKGEQLTNLHTELLASGVTTDQNIDGLLAQAGPPPDGTPSPNWDVLDLDVPAKTTPTGKDVIVGDYENTLKR